jgi:hypothetical protein
MRYPVLRRRGDVVAEAALELVAGVPHLYMLLELGATVKHLVTLVTQAPGHLLASSFDMLPTQGGVVEHFFTVGTPSTLKTTKCLSYNGQIVI